MLVAVEMERPIKPSSLKVYEWTVPRLQATKSSPGKFDWRWPSSESQLLFLSDDPLDHTWFSRPKPTSNSYPTCIFMPLPTWTSSCHLIQLLLQKNGLRFCQFQGEDDACGQIYPPWDGLELSASHLVDSTGDEPFRSRPDSSQKSHQSSQLTSIFFHPLPHLWVKTHRKKAPKWDCVNPPLGWTHHPAGVPPRWGHSGLFPALALKHVDQLDWLVMLRAYLTPVKPNWLCKHFSPWEMRSLFMLGMRTLEPHPTLKCWDFSDSTTEKKKRISCNCVCVVW